MVFNSFSFVAFFVGIYALYLATMSRHKLQNVLLLLASYVFYGWWDYRFLTLLWASTVVDYFCAILLDRRQDGEFPIETEPYLYSPRARKVIICTSACFNLGMLGFFKYYDFFVSSAVIGLDSLGLHASLPLLNVVLPIGISFYTFQSLSYTSDVYRGELRACRNFPDFALCITFFPHLVAGPILRASELLPQVTRPRQLSMVRICEGGYLVLWGLVQKVVIADNLATIVDWVYGRGPAMHDGQCVALGTYAFAFQIYCDFAGYTDIARGLAKMMGFEFPLNFNLPYLATNPSDFWRRWHITLSTWLRDYLYIPLGGNRRGEVCTCVNLMLTMILGGLWHGAAWTFVLWGFYHGMLLVAYRLLRPYIERLAAAIPTRLQGAWHVAAVVFYFHLTCLGWLFFRAESISQVWTMLTAVARPWLWWIIQGANVLHGKELWLLSACALPLLALQLAQYLKRDLNVLLRTPALARGLAYVAMFYALAWYGVSNDRPFIYFQF